MEGPAEIIDNLRVRMGDVLARELKAGDRLCAVTEMFSLSAFSRLKEKLLSVKDARFIFTAPTFAPSATLAERMDKARRQFLVSEQNRRESSVVADEYELKLRNRMLQKAVARECADWIRQKAHFASPDNFELGLQTFLTAKHREGAPFGVMPFVGLTDAGLGYEQGKQLPTLAMSLSKDMTAAFQERFDLVWSSGKVKDVTQELADYIGTVYRENEPELVYFLILHHLFADQLDDFDEDAIRRSLTRPSERSRRRSPKAMSIRSLRPAARRRSRATSGIWNHSNSWRSWWCAAVAGRPPYHVSMEFAVSWAMVGLAPRASRRVKDD